MKDKIDRGADAAEQAVAKIRAVNQKLGEMKDKIDSGVDAAEHAVETYEKWRGRTKKLGKVKQAAQEKLDSTGIPKQAKKVLGWLQKNKKQKKD